MIQSTTNNHLSIINIEDPAPFDGMNHLTIHKHRVFFLLSLTSCVLSLASCVLNPLHLSSTCPPQAEHSTNQLFLCKTNPILIRTKINLTLYIKKIYGNFTPLRTMKNKPNTNPIKANTKPIKPKTNPIRTQNKANFKLEAKRRSLRVSFSESSNRGPISNPAPARIRMAFQERKKQLLCAKTCAGGQSRKRGANIHTPGGHQSRRRHGGRPYQPRWDGQ